MRKGLKVPNTLATFAGVISYYYLEFSMKTQEIMTMLEAKHPGESEFLQAVKEVLLSVEEVYNQHPEFEKNGIIERIVEPDRVFTFHIP